jgi:hypothetical protein
MEVIIMENIEVIRFENEVSVLELFREMSKDDHMIKNYFWKCSRRTIG